MLTFKMINFLTLGFCYETPPLVELFDIWLFFSSVNRGAPSRPTGAPRCASSPALAAPRHSGEGGGHVRNVDMLHTIKESFFIWIAPNLCSSPV